MESEKQSQGLTFNVSSRRASDHREVHYGATVVRHGATPLADVDGVQPHTLAPERLSKLQAPRPENTQDNPP